MRCSLLILLGNLAINEGFLTVPSRSTPPRKATRSKWLFSSKDSDWMDSLRSRQMELQIQRSELEQKWKNADCSSGMKVTLPDDNVRRVDVEYPLVACGSASGTVFVADLNTGDILAQSSPEEEEEEQHPDLNHIAATLGWKLGWYGSYGEGGTLAIAMHRNLICSAGHQGSVQIWRLDVPSGTLISQGSMKSLEGVWVTCLHLDDEFLWVGGADGWLLAFHHNYPEFPALAVEREPYYKWNFASAIVSLSLNPELGYGVCTTANGSVELFSLDDDKRGRASWMPPFRYKAFAQSVVIAQHKEGYSVICGGSDGNLYLKPLNFWDGKLNEVHPFTDEMHHLHSSHIGPVKCMACPSSEVLVTASGEDGSVRVWDLSYNERPSCLYKISGYKVWLGSLWTDGLRLVSDGRGSAIVVHDFEKEMERSYDL